MAERTIVGIDVGTTKICTLVGQASDDNTLQIVGVGIVPSRGIHKGVITDIEQAAESIQESVQRAERVSGITITEAYVGLGGSHISSHNTRGPVAIGRGDRPVDRDDVDRAMEAAQAISVPHNRRIVHSIAREFTIDEQDGIRNPLGLMGYRLEVEAHVVTGAENSIANLIRCIGMSGIEVIDLVLQPLAAAEAVLSEEEQRMGVAVVDLGGGTTGLSVWVDGSPWQTMILPVGGHHITNDIAVGLRMPWSTAEEVKVRYAKSGLLAPAGSATTNDEVIEINSFGQDNIQAISRQDVCEITRIRVEEILGMVGQELRRSGVDSLLPAGVVITGGTANLAGLLESSERSLALPVRIGSPTGMVGLSVAVSSPAFASSVGLLRWGMRQGHTSAARRTQRSNLPWWRRFLEWLKILLPRVD